LPTAETLVTGHASVALFAILGAIFPDLFGAAEKAFFVFKGFDLSCKALQRKGYSDF